MRVPTAVLIALLVVPPRSVSAQSLPSGPVSAFDGRLTVGAEIAVTAGDKDEVAFFNYTDYEHNVLRMIRIGLAAAWRPIERVALVAEVRTEDFDQVRPYAAYLRVRPWLSHALDIQVGRIPPAFGAFGRRSYPPDNPLIGYPLAYQYLTSLRSDAIPATIGDLLLNRARGWRPSYPVGSSIAAPGLPLVSGFRWDTGVQAHWRLPRVALTGAVTNGTLGDPRGADNNGGKQVSGRLALHPTAGITIGASAARGEWLDREVMNLLPEGTAAQHQTAFGGDVELSRDHWLLRGELVWSRWTLPLAAEARSETLYALGAWLEGRYRLTPRVFLAGRIDGLEFSDVDAGGAARVPWDAPVIRIEADAGYYLQRNLLARLAVQHNSRDGGRVRRRTYLSGQVVYWF